MSESQMQEIRKLFAEHVHAEKVDDKQSLKELGLDSLDVVEMCLNLEDRYGIKFEGEELSEFKTAGDLFTCIEKKLEAKEK
jgi:acyl carrier protein